MAAQNAQNQKSKISQLVEQFNSLTEREKNDFLQMANVYFLRFNNRPVSPPPELLPVVNQIGKLSFLCQMAMQRAWTRRMDFQALSKVSEEQIRENLVDQILPLLQSYTKDLEVSVFEQQKPRRRPSTKPPEADNKATTEEPPESPTSGQEAPKEKDAKETPSKTASPTPNDNPLKKWASAE